MRRTPAADIRLARPLNITVVCGNGVAGNFAATLYRKLFCEVTELFCEVDGNFPNHHPDPSAPYNLEDLIARLGREARFTDAREIITIDGLRVEYADGFELMRASNTTPVIVLRFEADNVAALKRI